MPADGPPLQNRCRQWRWRLMIVVGLGVVAWLVFRDEALKPVDDLMPRRPVAAWDENNGWKRLEGFALGLPKLESKRQSQWWTFVAEEAAAPLPGWARGMALEVAHLPALEATADMPIFQERDYGYSPEGGPPGDAAILNLRTRCQVLTVSGMEENNVPLVLRLWKLFAALQRRITGGAASSYTFHTGSRWVDEGLVVRSLACLDWKEEELEELSSALTGDRVLHEDVLEANSRDFRRIYYHFLNSPGFPATGMIGETDVGSTFLYQKHRTANHFAKQTRVWRDSLYIYTPAEILEKQKECASSFPLWLDPNFRGTCLLTGTPLVILSPSYSGWRGGRRSIQVLIALHRCLKVRGALPTRLDELVPEFLSAVPEDPYSGGPLVWDFGHRAVQNTGGEGMIRPVDPKQTKLISDDYRTFLFRSKAEEDVRRANASLAPATSAP